MAQAYPDPCYSDPPPCDPNADCQRDGFLSENFTCTCSIPPFTVGDGFTCTSKPFLYDRSRSSYSATRLLINFIVPDPCLSRRCHANASCTREGLFSEGFQCTCDPDFTGDGYNCTEIEGNV